MKTKLRKEFEAFQKETLKRIYLLENPERFKFNEKVSLCHYNPHDKEKVGDGIYKGRNELRESFHIPPWEAKGEWYFSYICLVEVDNQLIKWDECSIDKFKEDAE